MSPTNCRPRLLSTREASVIAKAAEDSRTAMRYVKDGERVFRFFIKSFFSGFLSVGSGF